ncbi:MAG: hypothetical protein M1133_05465 [Armatimonadetes bacterium]|nr:hypothetical protein [Armatimonadota bacterium]
MRRRDPIIGMSSSLLGAAVYGAVVALAVAYVLAYFATVAGIGDVTAPAQPLETGTAVLARTGLNLYAMQHVPLVGSGRVVSPVLGAQHVSAAITLPLTVWVIIPILALIIGGYAAGKARPAASKWGVMATGILCGIVYALILAAASIIFKSSVDSSAIPAVEGTEFNPYPIPFHPSAYGTLVFAGVLGVISACLGSLLAVKWSPRDHTPGRWWACGKAMIFVALVIQLLMAATAVGWVLSRNGREQAVAADDARIVFLSPTFAGLGYAALHGTTLKALIKPPVYPSVSFNLYSGSARADRPGETHKISRNYLYIAGAIIALAALVSGWLAVRWGSRDGSIPTALRMAIIHTAYLGLIMLMCGVGWSFVVRGAGVTATTSVSAGARFDTPVAFTALGVLFFSLVGAYLANLKYVRRGGFPTAL